MKVSRNDITGDYIKSKTGDRNAYATGWDRVFGAKKDKRPLKEQGQRKRSKIY